MINTPLVLFGPGVTSLLLMAFGGLLIHTTAARNCCGAVAGASVMVQAIFAVSIASVTVPCADKAGQNQLILLSLAALALYPAALVLYFGLGSGAAATEGQTAPCGAVEQAIYGSRSVPSAGGKVPSGPSAR